MFACAIGKQLYVCNAYNLSLLGYSLVIAGLQLPYSPVFPLIHPLTGIQFYSFIIKHFNNSYVQRSNM